MNNLFDIDRFMPHGHCYSWDPGILWTSVISDALIFGSYVAIPIALVFGIMRKRQDLPFNWMFVCFGAFIIACGLTHLMEIITVWKPYYPISAIIKALTAIASVPTAVILYRIAPRIVQLPTLKQLVHEQSLRLKAEAASEEKDRFIAVLSHELRTPLTPVKAGLDLIEEELATKGNGSITPEVGEALKMVRRNLEMETTLINDLLDVSVAAQGKFKFDSQLVDLGQIIRQSLQLFDNELQQKGITLDLHIPAEPVRVNGASVRLHQIVNNLLSNAVKFTPAQGRITVTLAEGMAHVELCVRDNGCGIDPQNLQRIFLPFEQADRQTANSRAGLGLGLTIARTIAEAHHGRLLVQSAGLGHGATFILELPRADRPAEDEPPAGSAPREAHEGAAKPNILLVEDHTDTLHMLASLLRKAGYSIQTAENVRQAEPLLDSTQVLISDIGLPDGTGWDLMKKFRSKGGKHGIAISGFGQAEDLVRSRHAGFFQHLTKPIDIDVLKAALRALSRA